MATINDAPEVFPLRGLFTPILPDTATNEDELCPCSPPPSDMVCCTTSNPYDYGTSDLTLPVPPAVEDSQTSPCLEDLLIKAVNTNNSIECERLIKLGANVNIILDSGDNLITRILQKAAKKFNKNIFKLLIEAGCNIEHKYANITPLVWSIICNNYEAFEILLQNGADVNIKMRFNNTPLHIASTNDFMYDFCVLLVEYGADVFAESDIGRASYSGHTLNSNICEFLKKKEQEREMLNMSFKRARLQEEQEGDETDGEECSGEDDEEYAEEVGGEEGGDDEEE